MGEPIVWFPVMTLKGVLGHIANHLKIKCNKSLGNKCFQKIFIPVPDPSGPDINAQKLNGYSNSLFLHGFNNLDNL